LLKCIFSNQFISPEVIRQLKEKGINVDKLKSCFDHFCKNSGNNPGGESTEVKDGTNINYVHLERLDSAELSLVLDAIEIGKKTEQNQFGFAKQPEPVPIDECCCEDDDSHEHSQADEGNDHEEEHEHSENHDHGEVHEHSEELQHKKHHDINCPKLSKEERDAHKFHVFEVVEEEIEKAKEYDRMLEEKRKHKAQRIHDIFEISNEEEMKKAIEEDKKRKNKRS